MGNTSSNNLLPRHTSAGSPERGSWQAGVTSNTAAGTGDRINGRLNGVSELGRHGDGWRG